MNKHFLSMGELTQEDLMMLLDTAITLKKEHQQGIHTPHLKGKTLGLYFRKASTRTRISFEVAMYQLGGYGLYLNANDLQSSRGEPIQDSARVFSRYLDGLMIRTFSHQEVLDFAQWGSIPVINGLTDYAHPCQVLADLMTILEFKGTVSGLKIAFVGDGNNMANSLIAGSLLAGSAITVASSPLYPPHADILATYQDHPGFALVTDPIAAVTDADVVITDVWASMGDEAEKEAREQAFAGVYQVNEDLLSHAKKDVIVLHCLPAHREEEITTDVFEKHSAVIFEEAENRLHAQKAVLVHLMGNPDS